MKILYYITDHGLGHASRTAAVVRELLQMNAKVVIRNNDPLSFFKKSLPTCKIIKGPTDFVPIMNSKNKMKFDIIKTRKSIHNWIKNLPKIIEKESILIKKEKPDIIVSDVSIMPILVASTNQIKSVVVSNFVWSDTLDLPNNTKTFLENAYKLADLVIKLPLGTNMNFKNKIEFGLVARNATKSRNDVRNSLGIRQKKLVLVSLGGIHKTHFNHSEKFKIVDISKYSKIKNSLQNLEGQNLINASDLVICKCGYGFSSECLSFGRRFFYILEPAHKEAKSIHTDLLKYGLKNRLDIFKLKNLTIDEKLMKKAGHIKMKNETNQVAKAILNLAR